MPRPLYITLSEVKAKLPADLVLEALDDNADGQIDSPVWDSIAEAACNEVDASVGQRYTTPFAALPDTPVLIRTAALLFVCEMLYLRRGKGDKDTNPFLARADAMRQKLDLVADGKQPLTPTTERPRQSVSVITEPARTSSAAGHLAT